jgi:hypothetical protein
MNKYIQIQINNIDAVEQEKLIAILDEYGAIGFEQNENDLIAYFDEVGFSNNEIKSLLNDYKISINELVEQNWNE